MKLVSFLRYAIPSWWSLLFSRKPTGGIAILLTVWKHHAKRSGYSPVADGLGLALLRRKLTLLPGVISRRVAGQGYDLAYQIDLAMRLTNRGQLLIIDGDFQMKLIEDLRQVSSAQIFAVFHQVPEFLEQHAAEFTSGLLDGVVCVARCQMPFVESMAPPGRTWFVPHGIDTDYFRPHLPRSENPTVLCVGTHRRDFDTFCKAAEIIKQTVPATSVRLIAQPSTLPSDFDLGRIELQAGLDDEELRKAYQQAWVVLLPLISATANNSLLECIACGTPIVTTDVGGTRDYIGEDCGALCPIGDAAAHAEAVIGLLNNPNKRETAGLAARSQAEKMAWPKIREQIRLCLRMPDSHNCID